MRLYGIVSVGCLLFTFTTSLRLFNSGGAQEEKTQPTEVKACHINAVDSCTEDQCLAPSPRVVVIGDVHGAAAGLYEVMHAAGITISADTCEWKQDQGHEGTIFVQIGDIVDREDNAIGAWRCLNHLQATAPDGSKVVRILGNHEVWWLQGAYHMRHPEADTYEVVQEIVLDLKQAILEDRQHAAYVHKIGNMSILFIHAGLRPDMMSYFDRKLDNVSADSIAHHMNQVLIDHTTRCPGFGKRCAYDDEIFEAGPDRGGRNIGGPFWTDMSIIEKADMDGQLHTDFIQVVGHSVADCYKMYRGTLEHPPPESTGCEKGLVRRTKDMNAVCVDGGMYLGARTFLEISSQGTFISYERDIHDSDGDEDTSEYNMRNLTQEVCT